MLNRSYIPTEKRYMKMKRYRLIPWLLLISLMLSILSGCGSKETTDGITDSAIDSATDHHAENTVENENATDHTEALLADALGYGYVTTFAELEVDLEYIDAVYSVNGMLYFYGERYEYDNEASEVYTLESVIYACNSATGELTMAPITVTEDVEEEGVIISEAICGMAFCADESGYWVVTYRYTYDSNADSVYDDDDYLGVGWSDCYYLKKCDMDGNILMTTDLTESVEDLEWFYCAGMTLDDYGNVYLICESNILCYDSQGSWVCNIDVSDTLGYIYSVALTGNGTVVLGGYSAEDWEPCAACLDGNMAVALDIEVFDSVNFYPGDGDTVLLNDGTLLYSVDVVTGEITTILSWLDSDISADDIYGICVNGEDTIQVLLKDYSYYAGSYTYELGTLTKTAAADLPQSTRITLGATDLPSPLEESVIQFNPTNTTYRVTLVEDCDAGADIIYTDADGIEAGMQENALVSISDLISGDSDYDASELLAGPLAAFTQDGTIYGLPVTFTVETLLASYALVGDTEGWSVEEFCRILAALDEDVTGILYYEREEFLREVLTYTLDEYIDSATGSLDGDRLKTLLEACSYLSEEIDYGDSIWAYDELELLQMGAALLEWSYIYDAWSIKERYSIYQAENGIVDIGYPTDSGNGAVIHVSYGIAISAQSSVQDGAWEFIRVLLSDAVQLESYTLPVTVSALEQILSDAMEEGYYIDSSGSRVTYESSYYIGDTEYFITPITREQADSFIDYVNSATVSCGAEEKIVAIIIEEDEGDFSGQGTADEAVAQMQDRVSAYLGEIG